MTKTALSPFMHHHRTIKSHKKRNSVLSASTLFIGCAIASLLCLTLQARIYSKTVSEHGPFSLPDILSRSDSALINRLPGQNIQDHKKFELFAPNAPDAEFTADIDQKQDNKHPRLAETNDDATFTTSINRNQGFPPRVVRFEVPQNLRQSELPQAEDSSDAAVQNDKSKVIDNGLDNEIEHQAVEIKQDMDDERSSNYNSNANAEDEDEECVPMGQWQTSKPVNCNALHEIDLLSSIANAEKHKRSKGSENTSPLPNYHDPRRHPVWNDSQLKLLGQGWFRAAWRLNRRPPDRENLKEDETIILKMLRPERDFTEEFFELHRRDAVAMEQLTHSKFVLNIYGYCGQSALNEFASFKIPELSSLEKFDRQLRGKESSPQVTRMKLKLAVSVSAGLADAHELPADIAGDRRPSMVHYDLNPRNVAIVQGGMPKLNDFNTARFLKYNPKTNETCGAEANLHEPWWRAPEEVSLNVTNQVVDEKADIYALGNILFHILTTHSPRGKMKEYRMEEVRQDVLKGIHPHLPSEFAKSEDPIVVAFREAMSMCFHMEPSARSSAREVSDVLLDALLALNNGD